MRLGLLTIRGEELKGIVSQPFLPTEFKLAGDGYTTLSVHKLVGEM